MERNTREETAETVAGIAGVLTAGGVLTFALFPLLLPTVVLLAVLAVPLVPLALVGAALFGAFLALRQAGRWASPGLSPARRRQTSAGVRELRVHPR
jgi:hypothetical protein